MFFLHDELIMALNMSPKHVAPALKRMSMHRHTNNVLPPWRAEDEVEGLARGWFRPLWATLRR